MAKHYLRLVLYTNKGQERFAIGWENDNGSYELRGSDKSNFKAITGSKGITTIIDGQDISTAYIFESMLDFLSALMMKQCRSLKGTSYILNSTSLVKRLVPFLESRDWETIHLFFDNDAAGQKAQTKLMEEYPDHQKLKAHTFYADYNDVNDFWVAKCKKERI